MVLGIEAKAWSMLWKHSAAELHAPTALWSFRNVVLWFKKKKWSSGIQLSLLHQKSDWELIAWEASEGLNEHLGVFRSNLASRVPFPRKWLGPTGTSPGCLWWFPADWPAPSPWWPVAVATTLFVDEAAAGGKEGRDPAAGVWLNKEHVCVGENVWGCFLSYGILKIV